MSDKLSDDQMSSAFNDLVINYPKVERVPVDPPIGGQQYGLLSLKALPKSINGIHAFFKFRGSFSSLPECEKYAQHIIRSIDSKHKLIPFKIGTWLPLTTNEEFFQEKDLEVSQQEELTKIFKDEETSQTKLEKQKVKDIKKREQKLLDMHKENKFDDCSLDYYTQQVMKIQQLEGWLEQIRSRKRDMLNALQNGQKELDRLNDLKPEYKNLVNDKIKEIKAEIGLDEDSPLDRPSISMN